MVSIPSSIAFFILGFITCVLLVVGLCVHMIRKEEKAKKEAVDTFFEKIYNRNNNDNKDE